MRVFYRLKISQGADANVTSSSGRTIKQMAKRSSKTMNAILCGEECDTTLVDDESADVDPDSTLVCTSLLKLISIERRIGFIRLGKLYFRSSLCI
jgi:hypothetical protein